MVHPPANSAKPPAARHSPELPDDVPAAPQDDVLLQDLVRKHATRLQRFIVKHIGNHADAEDLAQQAFLEAVKSFHSFRGESQLSTWLYGIALNLVRNHLARAPECRYCFVGEEALADHATPSPAPDGAVEQAQAMLMLQQSLAELPENMRDILLMVGLEDLSYEEAAAMLTVPIGTVRSRLSRARAALREKLRKKGLNFDL